MRLNRKTLNKKGMTLLEAIIGIAILAISALMLLVGFGTCANLINDANRFKNESVRVSTNVEVGAFQGKDIDPTIDVVKPEIGTISFKDSTNSTGNIMFNVNGNYYKYKDDKTGVNYTLFVPDSIDKTRK